MTSPKELVKQWDAASKPQELANAGNAMREYLAAHPTIPPIPIPEALLRCRKCGGELELRLSYDTARGDKQ